jgi:hypothetical protein
MFIRRHWIPPAGLLFGQLCHGASWLLALWIAVVLHADTASLPAFSWIHLVALGWFTVTAFSILLHAIPAFLDVTWKNQSFARGALSIAAAAVVAFVVVFSVALGALGVVATILALALFAYLVTAWGALAQAFSSADRIDRAVARAFAMTLATFALVVVLGAALAWALSGAALGTWIARLPAAHGNLALFGWLTLLIYGVSARTLRPITGTRSRWPKMHVIVGSATLLGALALPAGLALQSAATIWVGGALLALGAVCYIADAGDILCRAVVVHRPPQAFIAAALFWLAVSLVLGAGVLLGKPWQAAYVFVLLMGWIAAMVDAHIFHIGVRLISTIYRGEDDQTRPSELLEPRFAWASFALFQLAVSVVTAGLIGVVPALVAAGAAIGALGWVVTIGALLLARRRAISPEGFESR